ncbi:MAG TPA: hypothetical protein VIY48_17545 [Candidatus Paceibacterota bacterium]
MATVPAEITWVSGQVVTAAQLNTNLRDAVNFLINKPTCQVRQTVSQNLTTGSAAAIAFDTEDVDNDNMHSTTTNTTRLTAVTSGRYHVGGGYCAASTTGRKEVWVRINGGDVNGTESGVPGGSAVATGPALRGVSIFLNAGNYTELWVFQDSGGTIATSVSGAQQASFFALWTGTT